MLPFTRHGGHGHDRVLTAGPRGAVRPVPAAGAGRLPGGPGRVAALSADRLTPALLERVRRLNDVAVAGGRSLAQLAVLWVLRDQPYGRVTSALIGASRPAQVVEIAKALDGPALTATELAKIEQALAGPVAS